MVSASLHTKFYYALDAIFSDNKINNKYLEKCDFSGKLRLIKFTTDFDIEKFTLFQDF